QRQGVQVVSTSVMIVTRESGTTTPVGVILPISAGAHTAGVLSADELSALTAPVGSLTEQLAAVSGTDAVLAVDPAIAASIRVLGTAAPESAVAWLLSLDALPNTRFALQYGDADVATQVAAGVDAPLQPLSLQSYLRATDSPEVTPSPEPSATEPPPDPTLPGLEALLDIGAARSDRYWPEGSFVDQSVVESLGSPEGGPAGITIVPSSAVGAGTGARVAVGETGAAALAYDTAVSTALSAAAATDENVLRGHHLAAATALLELVMRGAGDTPVLVALDRGADRSRIALSAAIRTATELPTTRPAALVELVDAPPRTVTVGESAIDPARVAQASTLFDDERRLTAFATILTDPTVLTGRERAELLQLLGVAWIADAAAWMQAAREHREATTTTLGAVSIVPPSHINLFNASAPLQFWVRNELPYPVNVVLFTTPDDLRLDVQRATPVDDAMPNRNTRVAVPVEARIGNGEVTLDLELRSANGVRIGPAEAAEVSVRADWEGIGVTIVLVLVGGFVALGLVRTILRRRGGRKTEEVDASGPPPDEESS
ncbi:MAG: DUF6049 family protein, partial [Microbacterium sp.]|uniref:DUF6049 family protein n=1 Tax=Microbacterium sp. TaxID=51671 RepID=UPI003A840126